MSKYGQEYVLQRRLANYSYLGCDFTKPSGRLREKKRYSRKKIPKTSLRFAYRSHSRGTAYSGKGANALKDRDQIFSLCFNYSHVSLLYALGGC